MSIRAWMLVGSVLLGTSAFAQEPPPAPSDNDSASAGAEQRVGAYERALPRGASATVIEAARGCDLADLDACLVLGAAYVTGEGVPRDRPLGLFILHDACAQGYDNACAIERRHASS